MSRAGWVWLWGMGEGEEGGMDDAIPLSFASLSERVNKRRVKEMVKEFTLLCRGLHGTDYTADY